MDVIEGNADAGTAINIDAINIDQRKTVSVTSSQFVQIGDGNVQEIKVAFEKLLASIEQSSGTAEQKNEAKGLLRKFLEHPMVYDRLSSPCSHPPIKVLRRVRPAFPAQFVIL